MIKVSIDSDGLETKVELEGDQSATEMIRAFSRMLYLQGYNLVHIMHSLEEVKSEMSYELIECYENSSNE